MNALKLLSKLLESLKITKDEQIYLLWLDNLPIILFLQDSNKYSLVMA